jgi:hypothetical protein
MINNHRKQKALELDELTGELFFCWLKQALIAKAGLKRMILLSPPAEC